MRKTASRALVPLLVLTAPLAMATATATAQQIPAAAATTQDRAIAAGYKAAMYCAGMFNAGRTAGQIDRDELRGIYPQYDAIVPTLTAQVDRTRGVVTVAYDPAMPPRRVSWTAANGCTAAPIGSVAGRSAAPAAAARPAAAADPRRWPLGDAGITPSTSPTLHAAVATAFDRATHGAESETVGVVVVKDGKVVAERYRDGFGPFVSNRTWSVGKSIAGTLLGIALHDAKLTPGARTTNWPLAGDPRGAITYDQLLRMASGLHSDTAGNRTDAIYFGGTTVTEQATAWPLEARPGTRFRYANNDILLAVHSLRGVMRDRYRGFPQRALFAPLGMTHSVAETDWQGNYILSSQVWSTARDLARLGQLWLDDGVWNGRRLLPAGWMTYMTTPSGPQPATGPGYGATMWLFGEKQGLPAGSYAAQGNRGQYVMVVPSERLVVVRRGEDPGAARFDVAGFTAAILAATRASSR